MKTVKLLLNMVEPIHWTGKVVMRSSGFCVVEGLMALDEKGVYGQFLIRKGGTGQSMSPGNTSMTTWRGSILVKLTHMCRRFRISISSFIVAMMQIG